MNKAAIFASGLLLISMGASANISDLTSACELLSNEGIKIRKIYQDQYDNLYHCNSDYYDVDTNLTNDQGLSNNIAYYVTGPNSNNWDEIKIVANINTPQQITETHQKLRAILGKVTSELAGRKIVFDDNPDTVTDDFFSMVHAGKYNKPTDWFQSGHIATLTIDEWPNNKGFEYRFILKK
jgi:hypothetical protein